MRNNVFIEGIRVDNCVLWNDWGKIFEFGAETVVDTIRDVVISNCYVPVLPWWLWICRMVIEGILKM